MLAALRESGPVPGDENGMKNKRGAMGDESAKKKKRTTNSVCHNAPNLLRFQTLITPQVDMDKLADGLQKLGEDDLLQVVQLVHDNKSADSYTKNDVERKTSPIPPKTSWLVLAIWQLGITKLTLSLQRANSTWICTPFQTPLSRCSGTLHPKRVLCKS